MTMVDISSGSSPFRTIVLQGRPLSIADARAHFQRLLEDPQADTNWCRSVVATLLELEEHGELEATTSGTTGPPKQYRIPQSDLLASAALTASAFGLQEGDRALLCLPCEFVAGKLMLVRACTLGLDLYAVDPRGSVLERITGAPPFRFAAMVPLQLHRALQEDRRRVEDQFGTILLGGGPVSDALLEDLQGLRTRVFLSYGSTETVTHVALRTLNGPDRTDHFRALGECHFARDPRGCLVVYTPHLTVEQHVTNDLVELLDDTHFRWLGRHDHVILSGGKKIFPEQLEARTAGVIPYPHYFTRVADDALGQAVMLVLETERPQNEVLPEVMEKVMATLQPHEWPRRVQALRRIQRTASGKVIRG